RVVLTADQRHGRELVQVRAAARVAGRNAADAERRVVERRTERIDVRGYRTLGKGLLAPGETRGERERPIPPAFVNLAVHDDLREVLVDISEPDLRRGHVLDSLLTQVAVTENVGTRADDARRLSAELQAPGARGARFRV